MSDSHAAHEYQNDADGYPGEKAPQGRIELLEGLLRETLAWLHDDAGIKKRIRAALGG